MKVILELFLLEPIRIFFLYIHYSFCIAGNRVLAYSSR